MMKVPRYSLSWSCGALMFLIVLLSDAFQQSSTVAFSTSSIVTKNLSLPKADCTFQYVHGCLPLRESRSYPFRQQLTPSSPLCSTSFPDGIERKEDKKVARRYRLASILYFITFASLWVSPNRMVESTMSLGTKVGGACGYAIASGVYHVLQTDDSSGLQRCNWGLLWFALVGLLAFPGEAAFHSSLSGAFKLSALMTLSKLYAFYASFQGLKQNIQLSLWKQSIQNTWNGLWQLKDKAATMYRNQLYVLILFGLINHFLTVCNSIQRGQSPFLVSLTTSAIARLGLISSMVYSLKEAAEQNRLNESSFIKFNLLLSAWTVAVGINNGIFSSGYSLRKSLDMFIFGAPFIGKAYFSIRDRLGDEMEPVATTTTDSS